MLLPWHCVQCPRLSACMRCFSDWAGLWPELLPSMPAGQLTTASAGQQPVPGQLSPPLSGLRMHWPIATVDLWEWALKQSRPAEEMQLGGGGEGMLLGAGATSITALPRCCRHAPDLALLVQTETFEEGRLISSYVDKPTNKYSITLANIGLSGYLQMLLKDNFVHADLHPGNILVRLVDPNTLWGRIATFLKVGRAEGQHVDRQ